MRVVAGTARGKKLSAVPGDSTRPILDRVKTALFDILRPHIQGMRILDVFAGSGGVGIEALSQGAAHCTFIDLNNNAFKTIKQNLEATKLAAQAAVYNTDAFSFLRRTTETFDLVYIAPPQYEGLWIEALRTLAERPELVSPQGMIVVQIDPKEYEPVALAAFSEERQKKYGNTLLVFYRR
ncbi:MAG: 16S rRNA (guanine(966)-N(2))-methyltransferase RsmD [Deltaproteobacteria bacterium]|nr:16S rRNA (guanine(966)-N(2))-methyltransferase RsmD [Deltaproteobacteria bacterium]